MSKDKSASGLQGTRLPPIGSNGAVLLSEEYRNRLVAIANALCNLQVIIPSTDGQNVLPPQKARVDISELSMTITMPPSSLSVGSTGVPFSGSGAPTSSTLSSAYGYVAGPTPSLYVDLTGLNLWVCTTAGTNSTSVWSQISSSGGTSAPTEHQFIMVGDGGDFWWCIQFDNQVYGGWLVPVIKPHELRSGANGLNGPYSIRGGTYSFTYSAASTVSVTVNGVTYTGMVPYYSRGVTGSASETDYAIPDKIGGISFIYAIAANVSLGSVPFTVATVTLTAGGTGYTAGTHPLTTGTGTKATVTITVSGGVIQTVTLASGGNYTVAPTLTGISITGGGGSGATFTITLFPNYLDTNAAGAAWAH